MTTEINDNKYPLIQLNELDDRDQNSPSPKVKGMSQRVGQAFRRIMTPTEINDNKYPLIQLNELDDRDQNSPSPKVKGMLQRVGQAFRRIMTPAADSGYSTPITPRPTGSPSLDETPPSPPPRPSLLTPLAKNRYAEESIYEIPEPVYAKPNKFPPRSQAERDRAESKCLARERLFHDIKNRETSCTTSPIHKSRKAPIHKSKIAPIHDVKNSETSCTTSPIHKSRKASWSTEHGEEDYVPLDEFSRIQQDHILRKQLTQNSIEITSSTNTEESFSF